jgi:hypothetical protein
MQPSTVLAALAELAPAGGDRVFDVTRGGQPLTWLDDAERAPRRAETDRLAALDALHRDERLLRRGWGFVAGRAEIDGTSRKIRLPLLSQPVRLDRGLGGFRVVPAGDIEVTPLVEDRALAAVMEGAPGLAAPGWLRATGSRSWLWSVAEATGLPIDAVSDEHRRLPNDRLVLVAAAALFVVRDVFGPALGDSLRSWAGRDLEGTALSLLYRDLAWAEAPTPEPVRSPLPLTEAQTAVVRRVRTAPVTVVSGPPGNGKSHTVVAAALEVVHRGGSVLVATQSPHAAEVLADLLARYPGPDPVLFGDAERRTALAAGLAAGAGNGVADRELRADRAAVEDADAAVRDRRATLLDALATEQRAASLPDWQPLLPGLAADVPGAFDDAVDPSRVRLLLDRAGSATGWRARYARWRVRRLLGARAEVPDTRLSDAIEAAGAQRCAARLAATGGTDLSRGWAALHDAEAELAATVGAAMRRAAGSGHRWNPQARRQVAALAAALRAGRNRRRELLAGLDGPALVRALPLWIGTVADVEDLLPPVPGLFDLVVVDEASHVDQIRAAPVLARARRALIVGDPRQLRFVSFVSDVDVAGVLARHGVDDRLDVRRVSAYDLAAGAVPVTWLDEHHRSVPQLIGFSAKRFYDDRIAVATRHPRTETTDVIDVVRAAGPAAEVTAVVDVVRGLTDAGRRGIGVVSPFRAQAEALEAALLRAFPADRIEEFGLRVGTVHAYQGSEADVVVASLGLAPGDAAGRRRFVADPHLFNVLITRARQRFVVVTSLDGAEGVIGDYLAYAEKQTGAMPEPDTEPTGWTATLRRELLRLGVPVRVGYRVGSWRLDLCAGPAASAVGVLCGVHPDGAAAHLARHRFLHRAGWTVTEAFPSRWQGDPRRAALEISAAWSRH